ncbi:hypothetical protein L195_g063137, partial [Trifolium pratense]
SASSLSVFVRDACLLIPTVPVRDVSPAALPFSLLCCL